VIDLNQDADERVRGTQSAALRGLRGMPGRPGRQPAQQGHGGKRGDIGRTPGEDHLHTRAQGVGDRLAAQDADDVGARLQRVGR
jgi:hypothetical protein